MVFADKKLFKNEDNDIHVGINAPKGFKETTIEEVKKTLLNMDGKRYWRCFICNDFNVSKKAPETCPTCLQVEAYIQTDLDEIKNFLEI